MMLLDADVTGRRWYRTLLLFYYYLHFDLSESAFARYCPVTPAWPVTSETSNTLLQNIAVQISAREPAPVARQPRPDQPAGPAASRPQPREDRHRPREDGGGGQVRSYWSALPLY